MVHAADSAAQLARHLPLTASYAGDLAALFAVLAESPPALNRPRWASDWLPKLQNAARAAAATDSELLSSAADPIHPMRVYGELLRVLDDDAVVIGDGGDFVSYAGKYIEPKRPGGWLDPGPYGCLGTGLGYAIGARITRPDAQVVLLLGDGAAGFSLMDVDTLVRHRLPVVMICGNNGIWGLEKHPMQAIYGYDVAADLQPQTRYDDVVRALGGAGELVTRQTRSPRRCAGPSVPASPTWSMSSPTRRWPTPGPLPASEPNGGGSARPMGQADLRAACREHWPSLSAGALCLERAAAGWRGGCRAGGVSCPEH